MKQLIIYDDNEKILDVFPNLKKVEIEDDSISWENGGLTGLKRDFLIVNNTDDIKIGKYLSEYALQEAIDDFRSEKIKKEDELFLLQEENAQLIMDSMIKDFAINQTESDYAALIMELVRKGVL
ncbi:hypothetical protein [Bacillus sp. 2205SS5-2]|uniref:hypothetical protein n=1 Tax=Bacillus sp. 2205SS5-2 TaxID=3109031 RepID=UPI0030063402